MLPWTIVATARCCMARLHWFPLSPWIMHRPCSLGPDSVVFPFLLDHVNPMSCSVLALVAPVFGTTPRPQMPWLSFHPYFCPMPPHKEHLCLKQLSVSWGLSLFLLPSPFLAFTFSWNNVFSFICSQCCEYKFRGKDVSTSIAAKARPEKSQWILET